MQETARRDENGVGRKLIGGALILTVISLAVKVAGMLFRIFLTARIGTEGMGLYQLTLSVYSMFATVATAGFSVAVSRLAAERTEALGGKAGRDSARRVLAVASAVAALIGIAAALVLYFSSGFFALNALRDPRCADPLRILAVSMPFMAVSACVKGYFTGTRQIYKPSAVSMFEQLVKIGVTMAFLYIFYADTNDAGKLCIGIVAGLTVGEAASYVLLAILYLFFSGRERVTKGLTGVISRRDALKDLFSVAMPVAGSAYIVSALHTVESMLIPIKFAEHGGDTSEALSQFGIIRGMAIPILFFPFAFLGSLASIALPEITRLNVAADKRERDAKISKLLSVSFLFGIGTGALFFFFPQEISIAMYKTAEPTEAIRVLAAVTPFMYVETVTDSLLKSIGEQFGTFKFSIYNSVLRIAVIMLLISHTGAEGYLWLLVISNVFSFLLCVVRLAKVSGWRPSFMTDILLPVCASVASCYVCRYVLLMINGVGYRIGMCIILVLFAALYGAVCLGAEKWKKV